MTNQPPWTGLTIDAKSIPLGSWVTPKAEINGHTVPLRWGANHIPAHPDVHRIHIYMPWIWRFGKADITVDNRMQPAPPVYYAPPFATFLPGAIGLQPVKNPGLLVFLLIFIVPLILIVGCCIGTSLLDSN